MQRRVLGYVSLLALAACQSERSLTPSDPGLPEGVSFAISDGGHGGNPNFLFLPPMVPNPPAGTGTFNPNLSPTVKICEFVAGACLSGGYSTEFLNVKVTGGQYHQNWKLPKTSSPVVYRVSVWVENVQLGFADVTTSKNPGPDFVERNAGATLPIKFRINTNCTPAAPCGEGFVDPGTGGTVLFGGIPGSPTGGVTIPAQPGGGDPITVTIQLCPDGDLQGGLEVFGSCLMINSSLGEAELVNAATVFICDVVAETLLHPRRHRIHLHRKHNGQVNVLPNTGAPECNIVGASTVGGMLRALVHGEWTMAGKQIVGMLAPKPLYARRRLNLGAGGKTCCFSDFQFAEEASFEDGFEVDEGWTATGFWHRSTLKVGGNPIVNSAYPGFVTNASGDASAGALPNPFGGSYVFWYGEEADGNYLGTQVVGDVANSGGTSTGPNNGTLTSPAFLVPSDGVLRFNTWFELESVDVQSFDLLTISIEEVGGPTTLLGQLNPAADQNGPANVPFTSAGFNTAPVWREDVVDLSAYASQNVRLIFKFNTVDGLYNGFRGWLLDNVRVASEPTSLLAFGAALSSGKNTLNPPQPVGPRSP